MFYIAIQTHSFIIFKSVKQLQILFYHILIIYSKTGAVPIYILCFIIPFVWAAQLDGNPVEGVNSYLNLSEPLMYKGTNLNLYLQLRPPIANNRPLLSPGNCVPQ